MDAEQAKLKNTIDMAFAFSSMTRVFEKKSKDKIVEKLILTVSQLNSLKDDDAFRNLHNDFCQWFEQNVKTAERKWKRGNIAKPSGPASYGHGAKVLNCALHVYVHYCHLPNEETTKRIISLLDSAIDTKMMEYLKKMPDEEAKSITATAVEDVDKITYLKLRKLVSKDIVRSFSGKIYPVQWYDIKFRELNNKDKKKRPAKASVINRQELRQNSNNHQVPSVKASISGQTNIYKTGVVERQEILEITLSKPDYVKYNIPWTNLVEIKLVIGQSIYDGTLNLKRKDGIPWISSVIHDSRGKKLALRTPLIAAGYNKGDRINLQINVSKKELEILPLALTG